MKRLYDLLLVATSLVLGALRLHGPKTGLRLPGLALVVLACCPAQAANYKFPSNMPPGCSGSGGNYTCLGGTLGYQDDYTIVGQRPATITFTSSVTTNNNSINTQGSAADLTIVVAGTLTLSYQDRITANVTADSIVDSGGRVTLGGSLSTTNGSVTLGYQTTVAGSITSTTGAITMGDSGAVNGSITSTSGAINVGYAGQVNGSVSTSGAITLPQNSHVFGSITGSTGNVSIGYAAVVSGALTTSAGTITFAQKAVAQSCVKSTGSATITLGPEVAVNSVCCGGSCTNSCVVNNSGSNMPPACAGGAMDHYELSLPTSSVNCLPTTVSVTACTNSSSPCTSAATTVSGQTANLSSGGSTSTVTFNGSGIASGTVSLPTAAEGTVLTVSLSGEQSPASNPRKCCSNGSACSVANACSTTFHTAGLVFSASAGGAVATLPVQTAGTASGTYFLRAVQSNTTTAACSAALTGANSVSLAYQCNNPSNCSANNLMTVNGGSATTIQRNNNGSTLSYTAVPMTFDTNGNAPFNFTLADVGLTTLWATKTVNSAVLSGASNAFVTKPAGFAISAVKQTASPNLVNPAAASATGAKFVKAGESFGVTVTAQTSSGVATPNFGKESTPEGVLLTQVLVLPVGGTTGTLANGTVAGGSFSNGIAIVTNLAWSDVGIIALTPSLSDGSYLGTGNVIGTTTGNVGRFLPDHFALSSATVTNRVSSSCSPASIFTYLGEKFRLGFTLTAQNSAGATTQNYVGSFAKFDPSTAASWNLAGVSGSTSFSSASGRLALGSSTGSWSSGVASGVALTVAASRASTADGPFTNTLFGIAPVDSDGVAFASYDLNTNPLGSGSSNDHLTLATVALRFGQLQIQNIYGSELLDLPIPIQAQYWAGSYYTTNVDDSCTVIPVSSIKMGNYLKQLSACKTRLSPTSSVTLVAGKLPASGLVLTKPGANNAGSVDLKLSLGTTATGSVCLGATASPATAGNMPWFGNNPAWRAVFGVLKSPIIYARENY